MGYGENLAGVTKVALTDLIIYSNSFVLRMFFMCIYIHNVSTTIILSKIQKRKFFIEIIFW